jgi:hypothetical protein
MESGLYGGIKAARIVTPEGATLDQIHDAYISMATAGHVTETQRGTFFSIGQYLCQTRGAEGIVLGGTDLFLPSPDRTVGFPWSIAPWFISPRCFEGPPRAEGSAGGGWDMLRTAILSRRHRGIGRFSQSRS